MPLQESDPTHRLLIFILMKSSSYRISSFLFWVFVCYCGVISALYVYQRPLIGDDLFYVSDLNVRGGGLKALPHLMAGVFMGCNGRWGDLTNTIWLTLLPRMITAIFAFIFAVLLPLASMKLSGLKLRQIVPVSGMAVIMAFLLPWHDIGHIVCWINYPWGAAIVLACLVPLTGNCKLRNKWWILGIPFAGMGAAWHEASGVPLVIGLTVWCCLTHKWKQFSTIKKWWFTAMIAGGLFTISSPAIWNRLATKGSSEGSMLYLLFSTANLSFIVFVSLIALLIANRRLLKRLLRDRFVVFATASIVSGCIVMAGGVTGRAGFFAQIYGAIALMRIVSVSGWNMDYNKRCPVIIALVLYITAGYYLTRLYIRSLPIFDRIEEAIAIYPDNHEKAYSIVMSIPDLGEWDAASLKVYDPKYNYKYDRTISLKLHAEEETF